MNNAGITQQSELKVKSRKNLQMFPETRGLAQSAKLGQACPPPSLDAFPSLMVPGSDSCPPLSDTR